MVYGLLISRIYVKFMKAMTLKDNYSWRSSIDEGLQDAHTSGKPFFLFFCSETCFYCHRMNMAVYPQQNVADLIRGEFVPVRITPATPELFGIYAVNTVPAFIVSGTDGMECERHAGFLDAEALTSFCLLALGKYYHDRREIEKAQQYIERLIIAYPQSAYAPEAVFLQGVYCYLTSHDPACLKTSLFALAQNYPDSIWVRRSLILHCHPTTINEWEVYQRQHLDYWKSQDAYLKAYFTYYNGPSDHHIKGR